MSAVSDRIAEVLCKQHFYIMVTGRCSCGYTGPRYAWAAHVAERIEAELQLTETLVTISGVPYRIQSSMPIPPGCHALVVPPPVPEEQL